MMPPQPGSGQTQYGVADTVQGPQMNAQAAALYSQAMQAWSQGNLPQAEQLFSQATQADAKAFQAYYSLGVVQERLEKKSAALNSYRKAFEIVPEYDRAMVAHGMLLAKTGELGKADTFFTAQRKKLPKSAALAAALAEVKSLQKDTASAQEIAQEALKIDPSYSPAMMTIARDHYRNRRLDLALYALKAVLDGFGPDNPPRDKDNAEAHLLRAFIWHEQELRPLAMGAFRKALELRPDLVVARLRLATYLLESGGAAEALPMLQMAVNYDSDNLNAHLGLGDAYRLTSQFAEAEKEFNWVKAKNANLPEVHYNLGLLYLFAPSVPGKTKKQQILAAIEALEKFKELSPAHESTDVGELLNQANLKKSEIEAIEKAKNPQPVPAPVPAPADGAAPADGGGEAPADGGGG
ncbi:MAG: tetratricopeptide repeat protein [Myxococcales bacterium]|nr:tetratricopeptide repeat protein [Myxococcales bacterium]